MAIYGIDFLGSEYYGLPKFSDFDANPFTVSPFDYGALRLMWATPSGDWDILRVVRNSYGAPDWEDDGTVIAEYTEEATNELFDENLSGGRFYYYAVFVREAANQRWHRAATALGLTAAEHGAGQTFFNWLPGWFQEQDNDLGNATGIRHADGPLKEYLKITGMAADYVRTEYESLGWTRDPDRISGNLLPLLGQQFGVPNEPALGMRRTRFWARDAVFLYRRKGTLPGIQSIVTTITGWDSKVRYDRNLLKGVDASAWISVYLDTEINDDLANSNPKTGDLHTNITFGGLKPTWRIATIPAVLPEGMMGTADTVRTSPDQVPNFATPVVEGTLYAATGEFLTAPTATITTGTVTPTLDWFDADGVEIANTAGDPINPVGTEWVQAFVAGIAPVGATHVAVRFDGDVDTRFRRASLESEHAAPGWVPPMSLDISLVPARTNYVTNPSFEYDLRTWAYSGDGAIAGTGERAYSGQRSADVTGRYEPATLLGGAYPISEGNRWHAFSTYFHGADITGEARVHWRDGNGAVVRTSPWSRVFTGTDTVWTRVWVADFAPEGAVSGEVELQLNATAASRSPDGLAFDGTAGSYATVPDTNLLDTVQASFDNVPFAGTVTPEDRYEIWGSGGGTGAGAPGAASPFLIDREALKTDDRHLLLPGKARNYGSIPDVNLLDADTAHLEKNSWANWGGGSNAVSTAVTPKFGTQVLKVGKNASDVSYARMQNALTIAASTQYSASLWVYCTDAPTAGSLSVEQYDGTDTSLGSTNLESLASQTGWQQLSGTFTSSASAASMRLYIRADGQPSDGVYIDAAIVRTGSDATFVPSTRIVGDIDLRAKFSAEDYSRPTAQTLVSKYNPNAAWRAYILDILNTGDLRLLLSSDGVAVSSATVPLATLQAAIPEGTTATLRATWRASDGLVQFFYSTDDEATWTQLGVNGSIALTSIFNGGSQVGVGGLDTAGNNNPLLGRVHRSFIRDGIDGPVVASYDFANAERGQTSLTTPEGHALTIHQNNVIGSGRAEIRGGTPKKVGWIPGAAGNYFSVADVNILPAPDAHFHGGIGRWVAALNSTVAHSTAQAVIGNGSLLVESTNATGEVRAWTGDAASGGSTPVTAGQTYTLSAKIRSVTNARNARLRIVWWDSTNTYISQVDGIYVSSPVGSWTDHSVSAVAPAGATSASVQVTIQTAPIGEQFHADAVCLRAGSATDFVPSHRITGDLDLRAKVALKDWTPTYTNALIGKDDLNTKRSYNFNVNGENGTHGTLRGVITGKVANSTVAIPTDDRAPSWVRVTVDVDNGASGTDFTFYTSPDGSAWTQLGAVVTVAGVASIDVTDNHLAFGSILPTGSNEMHGILQSAEVRDGIDGPIVAGFDADDPAGLPAGAANGASYTDVTTGHSVVLNASGDATAEIVDRNTWGFTGTEYLDVPDRDDLDVAVGDALTLAARVSTRTSGSTGVRYAASKRSGSPGYDLRVNSGAGEYVFVGPAYSPVRQQAAPSKLNDGADHVIASERSNTRAALWQDGTIAVQSAGDQTTFDMANTAKFRVGMYGSTDMTQAMRGFISWVAMFRRALTDAEHATLAAWDGKLATEPVWLRPLAVFYTNADDPLVRASYANNEVLNLGSAQYGELGWSIQKLSGNGVPYLSRRSYIAPSVGSAYLAVIPSDPDGGGNTSTWVITSEEVGPVAAGQTYSGSIDVTAEGGGASSGTLELVWFDAGHGEIGRTSAASQTYGGAGNWARLSVSGVAPTGAAYAALAFRLDSIRGVIIVFDAATIRQGADPGYVPSLRVRHDLDIRIRAALDDWTPASPPRLLNRWNYQDQRSWIIAVGTNGTLAMNYSRDGVENLSVNSGSVVGARDGDVVNIRVVRAADTGAITFYTSTDGVTWTQLGSASGVAGTLFAAAERLILGAPETLGSSMEGAIHSFEIRDGVDGPILADADFTTVPWVEQDRAPTTKDDVTLVGPGVHIQSALFRAFVDAAMLEEGDYPGEYFDGSRFGADYIWGGDAHSSSSRHYPGRTTRNARLREILPDYLPIGQMFNLRFTEESELGGRAAGYGALGVGHTGSMTFGE